MNPAVLYCLNDCCHLCIPPSVSCLSISCCTLLSNLAGICALQRSTPFIALYQMPLVSITRHIQIQFNICSVGLLLVSAQKVLLLYTLYQVACKSSLSQVDTWPLYYHVLQAHPLSLAFLVRFTLWRHLVYHCRSCCLLQTGLPGGILQRPFFDKDAPA